MNNEARKPKGAKGAFDVAFPSAPKLLVVAVALACASPVAMAADQTWTTGNGDWSGNNWGWYLNNGVKYNKHPANGDNVTVDPTGSSAKTVTYSGAGYSGNSLTINRLTFSDGCTGDILDLTGGTLSVSSTFTAGTNSVVRINSGATLNLNGVSSMGTLTFLGGTLAGSGALTVSGATTWSGGTMTGSGSTAANGGLTVSGPTVLKRKLTGSTLAVSAAGTLDIQEDKNLTFTGAISNAGTLKKTGTGGTTTISGGSAVANTGTIIAGSGTLSFAQGVTGTSGTLQTTGGTLSLGANSTAGTLDIGTGSLSLNGRSLTVSTDYLNSNFGSGNSFNRIASVTAGGAGGVIKAAGSNPTTFQKISVDGGATKTNGNTTLAFGNIHVNSSVSTQYTIYDNAPTVTLRGAIQGSGIDPRLGGTGVDVLTSQWTAAAGSSTNKTVTLTGSSAGAVNSSVNIVNNFANTNSQTLNITGGVYQYAQVSAPSSVTFANRHVGVATSQTALSITNTNISAAGYQEALDASVTSALGAIGSGSFTKLAAGATDNSSIKVGLAATNSAGNQTGMVTIATASNGTGTSGLGTSPGQFPTLVSVSGNVYQYAQPTFTSSNPVNFGIVHVGATASQAVGITNTSAAPVGYQEKLNASISTASAGIATSGGPISLAQGASSSALNVGINTATAGARSGTATVALVSDGAGTSGLGTTNLASQNISVLGQVNNYASVGLAQTGGAGTFSGSGTSYTFDLGTITFGTGAAAGSLSLTNTGGGAPYTDLLRGAFSVGGVTAFTLTGFSSFSALSGGSSLVGGLGVALNNNTLGSFDQYVTLTPTGYNSSGYSGDLSPITLELKGNVVAAVPEPATYAMLLAGLGLMGGIARRRRQSV